MSEANETASLAGADNLQRPPYDPALRTTRGPLIVTPTLVSRVDDTPPSLRPHDDGSSVDRRGREVEHPERNPEKLAIEPDPNLAYERWDEYWRKVHGPKFAYEEPGSTSHRVLRYDQLHRLPSGPSTYFRPPYRAMIDTAGKLVSDPAAHVPPLARPKWDGLAYIAYASKADMEATLQDQDQYAKRIIADEQVAFRMVTREICEEHILIPSAQHRDAISLVRIHKRRPDWSRAEFQQHMLHGHADLLMSKGATHTYVRRYAQLHNIGSTQADPEGSVIDGLSILAFASVNDVEDYVLTGDYAEIESDEAQATGEVSEFWTAVNYSVINRLVPELATSRS
jgi:hypothetical protein